MNTKHDSMASYANPLVMTYEHKNASSIEPLSYSAEGISFHCWAGLKQVLNCTFGFKHAVSS